MAKLRYGWISRKMYRTEEGRVGRIIFLTRPEKYALQDPNDNIYHVDQEFAKKAHEIESRVNQQMGRPALFPGEAVSARLITLPDRLWKQVGKSQELSRIIERGLISRE